MRALTKPGCLSQANLRYLTTKKLYNKIYQFYYPHVYIQETWNEPILNLRIYKKLINSLN